MATPVLVTDGVTTFDAASMNLALTSDGTALSVKVWHGRLNWSGSAAQVLSSVDSAGISSVAFNGSTEFEVTLAGFTNTPVAVCTPVGTTGYYPKIVLQTNILLTIGFYNIDTGAKIVTGVGDTNMDFNIMIIGA